MFSLALFFLRFWEPGSVWHQNKKKKYTLILNNSQDAGRSHCCMSVKMNISCSLETLTVRPSANKT